MVSKARLRIVADGSFSAYLLDEMDNVVELLGPANDAGRQLKIGFNNPNVRCLQVKCSEKTIWQLSVQVPRNEFNSEEYLVEDLEPSGLDELVRLAVEKELGRERVEEYESIEEANDFDVEDDPAWVSPYEMEELSEDTDMDYDAYAETPDKAAEAESPDEASTPESPEVVDKSVDNEEQKADKE